MEKQILHIDCNKFYASVECFLHPELRDKPVAVGGSEKERHGIILTKNEIAAKYNLYAGEPIWQAKQKCPDLIVVEPNFPVYMEFSKRVKGVLESYTDLIEPFGLDESWIDVTGDWSRTGAEIADQIRKRIKNEIGITVSIGVSFNKTFAKLGSDYKKPDAVTIISRSNFKEIVWPLPCRNLLMIGRSTSKKLAGYGIYTIGELANTDTNFLRNILGKNGETLQHCARGLDTSPVMHKDFANNIKSIGNSVTTHRDMVNNEDIKIVFTVLAESVAQRMREHHLKASTVAISIRTKSLDSFTRQCRLSAPTNVSNEIVKEAMILFKNNYSWNEPVRSIGVSVTNFDFETAVQFDFSGSVQKREKLERLENAVDRLRKKYGENCIQKATVLQDKKLSRFGTATASSFHPFSS